METQEVASVSSCADPNRMIVILDANLELAVRVELNKSDGPILCGEMAELIHLTVLADAPVSEA
jgi:hypothetical protein